ncbi:MAG: sugar transferase [bacterium]
MELKLQSKKKNIFTSYFLRKTKIRKAIVLAGGQGTHLRPITQYHPPLMLPIVNVPIIELILGFLVRNGIEEITIAVSENYEIPKRLKELYFAGIKIFFHKENKLRGPAGTIKDLEKFINEEAFIVINGNVFIEHVDLGSAIDFHYKSKAAATVGIYRDNRNNLARECVKLDAENKITSFHIIHSSIDRRSPWRTSGIYIFNPTVLKFIKENIYMDIKEQLIPALQRESLNVVAHEIKGSYQFIESVNDYIRIQRDILLDNEIHNFYLYGKEEIAEKTWIGRDVKLSSNAYLLGPIVIGDGCTIGDWAQIIGPTVIGKGCQISEGTLIRESILWDGIFLSAGAKVEHSIIGEKSHVPNNSYIKNMIVLNGFSARDANLVPSDHIIQGTVDISGAVSLPKIKHHIYKIAKRLMDLVVSLSGAVLLLPFFLLLAIAIKIDSKGPVFYIQKRCGLGGKLFGMVKFRTMVTEAERLHKELISQNEMDGPMFKLTNDPRVTRLGKLLRSTSLDELPQLYNVLKGEMSLVGPRPLIMNEMKFSPSWRDSRLKVKPGLTGLWQIQGRSEVPFHTWIKYDMYYVNNRSLWLDLTILFKTIKVVIKKSGAY